MRSLCCQLVTLEDGHALSTFWSYNQGWQADSIRPHIPFTKSQSFWFLFAKVNFPHSAIAIQSLAQFYSCIIFLLAAFLSTTKMPYFFGFTQAKNPQKDQYSAVRTSDDDTSKDGILEKGQYGYPEEPTFWQRHKTVILVQSVVLGAWTLIMYFLALQIQSLSIHGPNLIHCKI